MSRLWAFRRRIEYSLGMLLTCTLLGTGVYYLYGYQSPTCFDRNQNGKEHGVDCGGACARYCVFEVEAPRVLWTDAFKIIDGQYNVVAYVENGNTAIGSESIPYTITLSDSAGVIVERSGQTALPPNGTYPIFEGRVMTGTRVPTKVAITLNRADDVVWLPAHLDRSAFVLKKRDLADADSKPRLTTEIQSTVLDETQSVELVATMFDSKGKPLTASRTVVEYFKGRATEEVVFTWPEPIAKTLRSCEVPSDIMLAIDLSGSMDDDGGTPAEPISSVLNAAGSFVKRLSEDMQVGVVTYATDASLVIQLSKDSNAVANAVSNLTIAQPEQRGSTNPGEALKRMQDEFLSNRHNNDARKVAILFTDGLANAPTKNPEAYATSTALELKKKGVSIYTIGLGAKVNQKFLREIATDKDHAFIAPTVKEVDTIYQTISTAICEDGATVIDVIAKPIVSLQ